MPFEFLRGSARRSRAAGAGRETSGRSPRCAEPPGGRDSPLSGVFPDSRPPSARVSLPPVAARAPPRPRPAALARGPSTCRRVRAVATPLDARVFARACTRFGDTSRRPRRIAPMGSARKALWALAVALLCAGIARAAIILEVRGGGRQSVRGGSYPCHTRVEFARWQHATLSASSPRESPGPGGGRRGGARPSVRFP